MWKKNHNRHYWKCSFRHFQQTPNQLLLCRFTGFTLIELMLGLAIIGALVAFALPSYFNQVTSARNSDSFNTLTVTASRMESRFLDNRHYERTDSEGDVIDDECAINISTNDNNHYEYTCEILGGGSQYLLTATSTDNKYQYTLNEIGDRNTVKFNGSETVTAGCWQITKAGECL